MPVIPGSIGPAGRWRGLVVALLALACSDRQVPSAAPPPEDDPIPAHAGFHAAPSGTAQGDGSAARPWDLPTALDSASGRVGAGDTVWLHGGTYSGGVVSTLTGAPGRPVVIRAYPGERAVINGAGIDRPTLVVLGDWAVYWGIELTNTAPDRTRERPNVVYNLASHVRYLNLVIHDGGVAFFTEPEAMDIEIAGCVIYNNGWTEAGRGAGHGLYLQSDIGPLRVRGNVVFNQFGYGIHAYSDEGSGQLNNIILEGNVAFNNGMMAPSSAASNILVGGFERADHLLVHGNLTYFAAAAAWANVALGWDTLVNGAMVVSENTFVGGRPVLSVRHWFTAAVSGNTLMGTDLLVELTDTTAPALHVWGGNRYIAHPDSAAWAMADSTYTFAEWRRATHLSGTDEATAAPSTPGITVSGDRHEPGRAIVTVVNWTRQPMVAVDLSDVLTVGDTYEIRNVQDLFGSPVTTGVYTGEPVTLLMVGVPPPRPVGLPSSPVPGTAPDFDVFLVTRTGSGGRPPSR